MAPIRDFENDTLDLYRINFSSITLAPKENNVKQMKKYTYKFEQLLR